MNYRRVGGGLRAFFPATPRDFTTRNSADADFATPSPSHTYVRTYVFLVPPGQFVYSSISLSNGKTEREREREVTQAVSRHDLSESKRLRRIGAILFHFPRLSFGDTRTRYLACHFVTDFGKSTPCVRAFNQPARGHESCAIRRKIWRKLITILHSRKSEKHRNAVLLIHRGETRPPLRYARQIPTDASSDVATACPRVPSVLLSAEQTYVYDLIFGPMIRPRPAHTSIGSGPPN